MDHSPCGFDPRLVDGTPIIPPLYDQRHGRWEKKTVDLHYGGRRSTFRLKFNRRMLATVLDDAAIRSTASHHVYLP
jgi:hypothetical protein